jgi:signal transduction histidine kinase
VVALRDASVRLGEGDFTLTAPHSGIPELDDAAAALTTTAHRLGATIERERAFAADASHQLRTPLASLRLAVENELVAPRPDPTVALHDVLRDVDRLDETVTSLLALARETSRPRDPVEVDGLVREAAARWQRPVNASGRMLRVDVTRRVAPVLASPMAVATILDVLLDNALHHGSGGISISVAAAARSSVAVVVEDEGTIGVPDGTLFARRSSHARDHGIGLALARSLAEAEGLRLVLATRQPTAFELILPGTA